MVARRMCAAETNDANCPRAAQGDLFVFSLRRVEASKSRRIRLQREALIEDPRVVDVIEACDT